MTTFQIETDRNAFRYYRQQDGTYKIISEFYNEINKENYIMEGYGNSLFAAIDDTFNNISKYIWQLIENKASWFSLTVGKNHRIIRDQMQENDRIEFEFNLIDGDEENEEIRKEQEEERQKNSGRWKQIEHTPMFCFRCEKKISHDDPKHNMNVNDATDFVGCPAYGSKFDHSGGEDINNYVVFVCDDCLSNHKHLVCARKQEPNKTGWDSYRYAKITNDAQLGGHDWSDETYQEWLLESDKRKEKQQEYMNQLLESIDKKNEKYWEKNK